MEGLKMKNVRLMIAVLTVIFATGCAGTKVTIQQDFNYKEAELFAYQIIDQASVTETGMSIFKSQIDNNLKLLGLIDEDSNNVIEITFTNYYMRNDTTRALVGVLAGADNITSNITIKEKDTGNVIAKFQVVSKNPTAMGTARGLIEEHANKITDYIRARKKTNTDLS